MVKLVLTLANSKEITYKIDDAEDATDTYYEVKRAMNAVANGQYNEVFELEEKYLIKTDEIVCCELRQPKSQ